MLLFFFFNMNMLTLTYFVYFLYFVHKPEPNNQQCNVHTIYYITLAYTNNMFLLSVFLMGPEHFRQWMMTSF